MKIWNKKILELLPWNVMVALSVVIGISLTFWVSLSMRESSRTVWKTHLEYTAKQNVKVLEQSWKDYEETIQTISTYLEKHDISTNDAAFLKLIDVAESKHKFVQNIFFVPTDFSGQIHYEGYNEDLGAFSHRYAFEKFKKSLLKDGSVYNLPVILSTPTSSFLKNEEAGVILTKADVPSKGFIVSEISVDQFIKNLEKNLSSADFDSVGLDISLGDSGLPLFHHSMLNAGEIDRISFEHVDRYAWGSQVWRFTWQYSPKALGGANYGSSVILFLLGGLMTLAFGWLVWRQSGLSEQVRREVVERTNELERMSRRFRLITENSFDLIAIIRPEGVIEYTNGAFHKTLGYSRAELKDKDIASYIHVNDRDLFHQVLRNAVENIRDENIISCRFQHHRKNWVYIEMGVRSLYDNENLKSNIVLHCRDITKSKEYAEQLATSEKRFKDFAESSSDWLWEVNTDFQFTYVSPGIYQTLGYSPDEMIGRVKFDFLFTGSEEERTTRDLIESRVERQQKYRDVEFWTKSKAGDRVCLSMSGIPIFNERNEFVGFRGAATNITTSKIDRENMYKLATTDHLTGLLNRARFTEELERVLNLSKRHKTQGVLLFVDLDQFKSVNDTYGHDAGDALIRAVADILMQEVRGTDTVARLGGDEFGIIMHNIEPKRAKKKVQKVIDELNALRVPYNGISLHVTMSVGMIPYPQEEKGAQGLLMRADLAMYRAKDMGRNRLFYDGDLSDLEEDEGRPSDSTVIQERKDSLKEQMKWVERLRVALEEDDFEIHYQPLVPNDVTERPYFEALLRLRDEDGHLGAPGIFIDAAEHFGLIQQLDVAVAKHAIRQQISLKKKGCEVDVSINLSGKSLGDVDVLRKLKDFVKNEVDINPKNFTFEITETAVLHDPKAGKDIYMIQSFMKELKDLGFKFALDDFGTGFSSFNYLKHLDVDVLKIDGSFILPLEHSEKDKLFVKAIADLSASLGIKTVAEFVENKRILEIVDEIGINFAQGYRLSKPSPDLEGLYHKFYHKTMTDFSRKENLSAAHVS